MLCTEYFDSDEHCDFVHKLVDGEEQMACLLCDLHACLRNEPSFPIGVSHLDSQVLSQILSVASVLGSLLIFV